MKKFRNNFFKYNSKNCLDTRKVPMRIDLIQKAGAISQRPTQKVFEAGGAHREISTKKKIILR